MDAGENYVQSRGGVIDGRGVWQSQTKRQRGLPIEHEIDQNAAHQGLIDKGSLERGAVWPGVGRHHDVVGADEAHGAEHAVRQAPTQGRAPQGTVA